MKRAPEHPNEPGRWTRLESRGSASLWRRDREDPVPVTLYYILKPPGQAEILYNESRARERFDAMAGESAAAAAA